MVVVTLWVVRADEYNAAVDDILVVLRVAVLGVGGLPRYFCTQVFDILDFASRVECLRDGGYRLEQEKRGDFT